MSSDQIPSSKKRETHTAENAREQTPASPTGASSALRLISPATTLTVGLIVTLFATVALRRAESDSIKARFISQLKRIEVALQERTANYEQILRGGIGLFHANDSVARQAWHRYFVGLDIERNYPGIQGVGYAEMLTENEVGSFTEKIRSKGFPEFRVWPDTAQRFRSAILFLEPFDERNQRAFGFDMFSEPVRRAAMTKAMETGQPAISGKVILVQETDQDVQAGFLVYAPLYRRDAPVSSASERREAIVGFVYSPFRMNNFMAGLLDVSSENIILEIHDGEQQNEESLMYRNVRSIPSPSRVTANLKQTFALILSEHRWTVSVTPGPTFTTSSDHRGSYIILISGALLTLLAVVIHRNFRDTHSTALTLASQMTSELRQSEETVKKLVDTLERKVEQRTKRLVDINHELEAFSYSISHDLRSPLRSIHGFTTALREDYSDGMDPEGLRFLDKVSCAADRMSHQIDDLLELSRVTRSTMKPTLVSLSNTAREIFESLQIAQLDHQVEWTVADEMEVFGDEAMIRSILQNIIENAWKYSAKQSAPKIEVGCERSSDPPTFFVRDNGVGFDPKHAEKVFQPFKRLHAEADYPGTGIGLATVRRMIRRHQGHIWIESSVDAGTIVRFNLGDLNDTEA